jgi:two-component system sensor histidine kinase CpxA
MVRLVLKIFLAYWIAAGVVIAISDFEPHRHIHNPELIDALDSSLEMNGRIITDAYEHGWCQEAQKQFNSLHDALYLATPDGQLLCGGGSLPDVRALAVAATAQKTRMTGNYALFQLIAVPITSQRGSHYVMLFRNSYSTALQVYGLLPGYTTIAISGVVTLFLAVLVALPIRRLREAAREISMGRLGTRVQWGKLSSRVYGFKGGDDIDRLVRDFNHMAERLQSLAEAQRLLLRDVSHELRSPLARMNVGLALARSGASVTMHEHLDRIETESARLDHLIGQILSLSYMDTIQKIDLPGVISLSELVVDLLPDVQYEAAQKNSVISTLIGEGCFIQGDEDLIRAAIENILRNAIRYTPVDGRIHVEVLAVEKSGERFSVVRVSDDGPGIPEDEIESVLEPFYRADKARHWQQDGFGIGLAIADRAVNLHGGTVSIRNKPDGGLIVEMRFPLALDWPAANTLDGIQRNVGP